MAKTIIEVNNLSKKYKIGLKKADTLHETMINFFNRKPSTSEVWVLKDINFKVQQGEVLGVIGANGAGKSTLLKILAQITPPTTGQIKIKGRVSSLLEVGTGFHPDLTGRENIYLNGAILGMKRSEIRRKFEEIVKFADIGKFLDTPVKHYSSGMYVRLAFAIAAHLDPDILMVDEVLSVGDFRFQKKSLGRMNEMSKTGRTVVFVSHSMPMIEKFCTRVVYLEKGRVKDIGPAAKIIERYYGQDQPEKKVIKKINYSRKKIGDKVARLLNASIANGEGKNTNTFSYNEEIVVEMQYQLYQDSSRVVPNFHVYSSDGVCVFVTSDLAIDPLAELKTKAGIYLARCRIPKNLLNYGNNYYIGIALTTPPEKVHFYEQDLFRINILSPYKKTQKRRTFETVIPGAVRPLLTWESRRLK